MSARPGSAVFPLESIRRLPPGMDTCAASPTATIFDPDMTMVPRSIGAPPLPSMIRTLVIAMDPAACAAVTHASSAAATQPAIAAPLPRRAIARRCSGHCLILPASVRLRNWRELRCRSCAGRLTTSRGRPGYSAPMEMLSARLACSLVRFLPNKRHLVRALADTESRIQQAVRRPLAALQRIVVRREARAGVAVVRAGKSFVVAGHRSDVLDVDRARPLRNLVDPAAHVLRTARAPLR